MTPTPKKLLAVLDIRDGHYCAYSGFDTGRLVPQHRQGGMGGRKGKHSIVNLVWLDSLVNGYIESDPEYQAEAKRRGIKVSGFADPADVPVLFGDAWFRLNPDGTRTLLGMGEANEMRALAGLISGEGVFF